MNSTFIGDDISATNVHGVYNFFVYDSKSNITFYHTLYYVQYIYTHKIIFGEWAERLHFSCLLCVIRIT